MDRELVCVTCPIGCRLVVSDAPGGDLAVSGNRCQRGAAYAREELLAPKRTVTATMRAAREGGDAPRRVPCKTASPFPKERVAELLALIYRAEAPLPVELGQVLLGDALGLGIDVVATKTVG